MYQEIFQAVKEEERVLLSKELPDFSFDNIVRRKSPNSKALSSLLHEPKPAGLSRGGMVERKYLTKDRCPAG
jgi:cell division protein FtsI/penicillin-binding protein 2